MKKKLKNTKNPKGVFPQVRVGVSKFLLIDTEILVFFYVFCGNTPYSKNCIQSLKNWNFCYFCPIFTKWI